MTDDFNEWWNSDEPDGENPYAKDTPAYWAWAGWKAGRAVENDACAKVCEDAIASISEFHPEIVIEVGENVCTNLAAAIRARREQ